MCVTRRPTDGIRQSRSAQATLDGSCSGDGVVLPVATGGMEPEEPKRIRPEVVHDIVWVLEHSCGDVEVTATVLRLFDASEAEFALAFAMSDERPYMAGDADIEPLRAKIARLLNGEVPGDAGELDDPPQTR